MKRRSFVKTAMAGAASVSFSPIMNWMSSEDLIIGHGSHQYKVDINWGERYASNFPVKDCHEMVLDKKGNIYLLTNDTSNNIIIYNTSGKVINTWGKEYPGAHGLTIKDEGGEEFLYISDNERHEVIKTTLNGRVVLTLPFPNGAANYEKPEQYIPTETAIADNGDIYVADGYGAQHIIQYDSKGQLLNTFGGRGIGEKYLDNAHGICIDERHGKPKLLVTDRMKNKLKYYNMDGDYLSTIDLPGAYICRPVIKGEHLYLATIWSGRGSADSGFISILDNSNVLISAPGGSTPTYTNNELKPMTQALKLFRHPHDVCIDSEDNLYVAQWNSGQSYPIKLIRV